MIQRTQSSADLFQTLLPQACYAFQNAAAQVIDEVIPGPEDLASGED